MNRTRAEIDSQPACWRHAARLVAEGTASGALPSPGVDAAVVGCGTSWFVAQAYAAAREDAGLGHTDAFAASEFPDGRAYPWLVTISRSGTTSEVEGLLAALPAATTSTVITGVPDSPAARAAAHRISLAFADEESVVQTRFATTALALLRASLGGDLGPVVADAERALAMALPLAPGAVEQVTFLGTRWTVGLAAEAALKCREAAQMWTESYPAMEFRHGPLSIAQTGRAVWPFGSLPRGLADEIRATGAALVDTGDLDPLAALVLAQRFAVAEAEHRGLDPDRPRNLSRSVILGAAE